MEKANFGQIVSFLFGIANDCLVDTYDVGDYRKIILPMMVIRRFDAVLEPTKEKVLKMKEQLDAAGITDQDEALCSVAGEAFCNSSPYTLSDLKSRTNQQQLKSDFILYLNGFSQNVQDIIKRFEFRNQIDKLSEHDILGLLISKFTDSSVNLSNRPIYDAKGNLVQPALDNHTMGTVFEEVIRKFNEETNITDAGRHFTPRDIVELITDLAFVPVKGKIQSTTYRIYDGACGTGGMLTVAEGRMQEMAKEFGKNVSIHLYGQENSDETYAIARSDMLVKGEGVQANNKPFVFLELADHLVKSLIGAGMLRIKLLHPLMALPDCFFTFGYLGVHLSFSLEIFRLCDAGRSVLLIQPELDSLELFRLLLQIADCIGTF